MGSTNIIVAFPKQETARNIRNILQRNGFHVTHTVTSGAQILSAVATLDYGVVILPIRLADMFYHEVMDYLPEGFRVVVIAQKAAWDENGDPDVISLSLPLTVHDLVSTVNMVTFSVERLRKKNRNKPRVRTEEEKNTINKAKAILMERNNMTEEEAHRYLQKTSMDNANSLTETAEMILTMMDT